MITIKTFSDLYAIHELFQEIEVQGIVEVKGGYIEVSNSLWLSIATDDNTFEHNGEPYEDHIFRLSIKRSNFVVITKVSSKNYANFLANIKARPSLFQKIFDWSMNNL